MVVGVVDDAEVDLVLEHLDIGDLLGSERVLDGLPETVRRRFSGDWGFY